MGTIQGDAERSKLGGDGGAAMSSKYITFDGTNVGRLEGVVIGEGKLLGVSKLVEDGKLEMESLGWFLD